MKTLLLLVLSVSLFAADTALSDMKLAWKDEDLARSKERCVVLIAYIKRLDLTVPEEKQGKDLRKSEIEHNASIANYEALARKLKSIPEGTVNYMSIVVQLDQFLPLQRQLKGDKAVPSMARQEPAEEAQAASPKPKGKIVAKLADGTVIEQ